MTAQLSFSNYLIQLKRCKDVANKLFLNVDIDNTDLTIQLLPVDWIDFAVLFVGTSCHEMSEAPLRPSVGLLSSLTDQPSVIISKPNPQSRLPVFSLVHTAACLVPPPQEVWTLGSDETHNVMSWNPVVLSSPSVSCLSGLVGASSGNCKSFLNVGFSSTQKYISFRQSSLTEQERWVNTTC